jgi:hypothetical protein
MIGSIRTGLRKAMRSFRTVRPLAFPPPYRAMLAISSDVEFTSWQAQLALLRSFVARKLECGFSYWLFGDPKLTWRLFDEDGRPSLEFDAAIPLIKMGIIDTLHSFGGVTDGAGSRFDRTAIARGLEKLRARGIETSVYTNHGTTLDTQNVGGDWATYQRGDVPGDPVYHLDLTTQFGCKFFWTDIDYDNISPFFDIDQAAAPRSLLIPQTGRDGSPIIRFRRFRGAFDRAPTADTLDRQVELVLSNDVRGYSIIYQHLGITRDTQGKPQSIAAPYLASGGLAALDRLADLYDRGIAIVTTPARLLQHAVMMSARSWRILREPTGYRVVFAASFVWHEVHFKVTKETLSGWFMQVNPGDRVVAELDGAEWELGIEWHDGRPYAGIPWARPDHSEILLDAQARSHAASLADRP